MTSKHEESMRIAVIGAGFAGLSASYKLAKAGHSVYVFEASNKAGGLASGFTKRGWKWSMEAHYHHWFTNDYSAINLAEEVGQRTLKVPVKTSVYYDDQFYRLDSPISLLLFSKLSIVERFRAGMVLLYLKLTPQWKNLEKVTSKSFLIKWMGERPWRILWEPLFVKKFGKHAGKIPASWFWGRIKKRSFSIIYPYGGFQRFVDRLVRRIKELDGKFLFNESVEKISKKNGVFFVTTNRKSYKFDKVISTLPVSLFKEITRELFGSDFLRGKGLPALGAVNLVVRLKKQFLSDGTYWLNINDLDYPFLVVVDHTNFMDKRHYGGDSLIYVGNYLERGHSFFEKGPLQLLKTFTPYLRRINPDFSKEWVLGAEVFNTSFAQPIIPLNYSKKIMSISTPVEGLYMVSMEQIYPWDRGTNYAIELGEKAAGLIINDAETF